MLSPSSFVLCVYIVGCAYEDQRLASSVSLNSPHLFLLFDCILRHGLSRNQELEDLAAGQL